MILSIIAAILTGGIFAPLGCITLWKKYIYFGDGFGHASLFAAVLSIMLQLPIMYVGIVFAVAFSLIIYAVKYDLDGNAAISVVSSCMLALSLVILKLIKSDTDLDKLLFGDIFSVDLIDIKILSLILVVEVIIISIYYNKLVLILLNRDIALVLKLPVKTIEIGFLILLSSAVFISIKIVGSLLVAGILLLPGLTMRTFSNTPAKMLILSSLYGIFLSTLSVLVSAHIGVSMGAILTLFGTILYFIIIIISNTFTRKHA